MRNIKQLCLVVLCTLFLGACGSTIKLAETDAQQVRQTRLTIPVPGAESGVVQVDSYHPCCIQSRSLDTLPETRTVPAKRSIYFDYDGYRVQDEFKALVEAHSK